MRATPLALPPGGSARAGPRPRAALGIAACAALLLGGCGGDGGAAGRAAAPGPELEQRYAGNGAPLVTLPPPHRPPRNLVVLVLDTLRADMALGPAPEAPMPRLRELAAQGVAFRNACAPAPWTIPSMTSLLTGLLPTEHGCADEQAPRLQESVTTYAEVLARAYGYETAVFSDVPWYRGGTGSILQGFARGARPNGSRVPGREPLHGGYALHATGEALDAWLAERDGSRPFFLLLHSFAPHDPYGEANHPHQAAWSAEEWQAYDQEIARRALPGSPTPAELTRIFLTDAIGRAACMREYPTSFMPTVCRFLWEGFRGGEHAPLAAEFRAAYAEGLRWVDRGVADAVAALAERGLLENTLLVVTADHGEAFGEHGTVGHGHHLHDELVRVPLVLRGPAPFDTPRALEASVALVDVLPTFFDWAGLLDVPGRHGRSLLPLLADAGGSPEGHPVLAEATVRGVMVAPGVQRQVVAARTAHWKYVAEHDAVLGTVTEHVYDLRADPEERDDLLRRFALADLPLPEAFCRALEAARRRLAPEVEAVDALHGTPYGAASGALTNWRPPASPCSDEERAPE